MAPLFAIVLCCALAVHSAAPAATRITIAADALAGSTSPHFLAHGYEPFSLWIAMPRILASPSALALLGHLRGATVRIGGITADWVHLVNDTAVSAPCSYAHGAWGTVCSVTTGAVAAIVDAFTAAGISTVLDVNELLGRDCAQPSPRGGGEAEWCGAAPPALDTRDIAMLVRWAAETGRLGEHAIAGLELGNELFSPPHLSHETAIADAALFARVANASHASGLPLFAPATNDCARSNNSDIMEALLLKGVGFSWHNYPGGNGASGIGFLLNASWLRAHTLGDGVACLAAWNAGGAASLRARGLAMAVTETAAVFGTTPAGTANTSSFLHGFFTLSNLGQMAREGVDVVARWGLPSLVIAPPAADFSGAWAVAADYWLYVLYAAAVGRGFLAVSGDEVGDALVWAHCSSAPFGGGVNGSVTLLTLNPSDAPIALSLSLPTTPRVAFVLEAPGGDVSTRAPTLNGGEPLVAGAAGDLPPLQGAYCGGSACAADIVLPPRSQAFFVLLAAAAPACA